MPNSASSANRSVAKSIGRLQVLLDDSRQRHGAVQTQLRDMVEVLLTDEYDAAQERGEISKQGAHVAGDNMTTANLGIRRDQIPEGRQIRDAEQVRSLQAPARQSERPGAVAPVAGQ